MIPLKKTEEKYDTYRLIENRLKTLIGGRWKNRDGMKKAAAIQDELCKKCGTPIKGWNSTEELRKWRNTH